MGNAPNKVLHYLLFKLLVVVVLLLILLLLVVVVAVVVVVVSLLLSIRFLFVHFCIFTYQTYVMKLVFKKNYYKQNFADRS